MPADPLRRESRTLIAAAKRTDCFIDPIIGFKPPLLPFLDAALDSVPAVDTLVHLLLGIPVPPDTAPSPENPLPRNVFPDPALAPIEIKGALFGDDCSDWESA